jgi:RND family efflux transporter MFP subunit
MKRLMQIPRLSFFTAAVTLLASTICFTGCGAKPENSDVNSSSLPTAQVHAQVVERKSRAATEDVVGTVRPKLSATLEAKVSGRIDKMLVVPGQSVKAGEMLAHLDAAEISSRLDQANAALEQAEQNWKRISTLFGQQASTKSEYDAADAHYRVAKGAAAEAKTMMSYCEVLAPFDGVITRKIADVGDLAAPGKPLLQMENPDTLRLEADVPEALVGNVKLGDKLAVRIAAVTSEIEGSVAELSPTANPNSRTYLVKLDLPGATGLRSGQFGRVSVPVGEASAIRVPVSAVIQRGQMELVFVVADNHAQMRLVKTGSHVGNEVELVSGLDSGEKIVTDGVSALTDGQPVTIKP